MIELSGLPSHLRGKQAARRYRISIKMKNLTVYFVTILVGVFQAGAQSVAGSNAKRLNTHVQMMYLYESLQFVKVIEVKNKSAESLYNLMNAWTIATFNSASDVVKRNVEDELLQGVGVEPGIVLYTFPRVVGSLRYVFTIETEDNKICFSMSDMKILTEGDKYTLEEYLYDKKGHEVRDKQAIKVKSHATKIANVLVNSLKVFLVENSVVSD